jgi:hypothetical protein
MSRTALPWFLLAAIAGTWMGTSLFQEDPAPVPSAPVDTRRLDALEDAVGRLAAQVEALRSGTESTPKGHGSPATAEAARPRETGPQSDASATPAKPDPADLAMWLEKAEAADRNSAETTASNLVRVARGIVRGKVADAILHLLREDPRISKAFVMRGLAGMKVMDPRVEARLIEIVRSVEEQDYDSHYYFHFIAGHMQPKSDAVVDLILDRASESRGNPDTILRGLRLGLSEAQRARAADALISLAENAGSIHVQRSVLGALAHVAGSAQAGRLDSLAQQSPDETIQRLARRAAEAARKRR